MDSHVRRLVVVLVAVAAAVPPTGVAESAAAARRPWRAAQHLTPVAAGPPIVARPPVDVAKQLAAQARPVPAPAWPAGDVAELSLAGSAGHRGPDGGAGDEPLAGSATVGGLPVRLSTTASTATAGPIRVESLGRPDIARAGRSGLMLRLSRVDTKAAAGMVTVSVDYSTVASAFGGDWARRLRLETVPECALTTPAAKQCQATALTTENDAANRQVSASLVLPGGGGTVMLATTGGTSSAGGDYSAASLSPSATWSAGGSTGDFTWSYPLRVPPAMNGPVPSLALGYSSQSLDGLTAATNTQPSWVGDGFSYAPGYIERRYGSCTDDGQANRADLCWANDNAVLSLPGSGGELIQDAANPDLWHPTHDGGSKVERVRDTSKANGDADGEYWRVTGSDGTRYYFGLNRLPGWTSGRNETASAQTVPVFGDDAGEPCHQATFSASYCTQAYRWNLDYVVDLHGNSMSYWYARDTNNYAREHVTTSVSSYTRASHLVSISYGTDNRTAGTDSVYTGTPAARVLFATADRCALATGCTTHDAAHWPDVPWDLDCSGSTCPAGPGPTFWSTRRLSTVTTQVATGAGTFKDVDGYTLAVSWLDPAIGDQSRVMWLNSVVHTGLNGSAPDISLPAVVFGPTGTSMYNRVNATDGNGLFKRFRLATIANEYGGVMGISYSAPDCVTGTRMPPSPEANGYRCYPVYWTPPGGSQILDYFHKYVVTSVTEADNVAGATTTAVSYTYPADGAFWHYDTGATTPTSRRTWSQWRGYDQVTVTQGAASETRSQRVVKYFRGRNGDKLPTGVRSQSYTVNGTAYADDDWLAGTAYQVTVYNGPGGAVVKDSLSEPWASGPTASRTVDGLTVSAYVTNVLRVTDRTPRDGGRPDRVTVTTTTYSDGSDGTPRGRPLTVDNQGDTSTTADDTCMRTTYARNDAANLYTLPSEVEVDGLRCSQTPTSADQVVSAVRTWYDDGTTFPTTPSQGNVTKTQELSVWNANPASRVYAPSERHSYDAYGRVLDTYDALDRKSSIAYTPASGGPVTGFTNTNPLLWTTTTLVEPAWGLATRTTDVNGQVTNMAYDALGRLTAMWLPGWSQSAHPSVASRAYSYTVRNSGGPSAIASSVINPAGTGYLTSYELFDGLTRSRQTQATAATGSGRVITDQLYDSRGHVVKTNAAYYVTGAAGTTLFSVQDSAVPAQTRTTYDGADRPTTVALFSQNVEKWRTSNGYGGDRVDTTPPTGATPTSVVTDSAGQVVELRQYHGATATPFTAGSYDATTYQYDHAGRRTAQTDARGSRWAWSYDQRGRAATTTDPDKGAASFTYDDAGQLTSQTDARGITTSYVNDTLARRTSMWQGAVGTGTELARWTYDTLQKGRTTSSTRFVDSQAYVVATTGFDSAGRPNGTSVTIPTTELGLAGTHTFSMSYNADGSVASTTLPGLGGLPAETLTTSYTSTGRPKTLAGAGVYVSDTSYLETGEVTSIMDGDETALQSYDYDPVTKRLVHWNVQATTTPDILVEAGYSFDPAGNLTKVANLLAQYGAGYGPDDNQCYQYDYLQRISQAWTPSTGDCTAAPSTGALGGAAPYWLSWGYDLSGNRTSQVTHTAAGNSTINYTYPAATAARPHALSSTTGAVSGSYNYDLAGNTTSRPGPGGQQTLTWTADGHLASVAQGAATTTYVYDAEGNRLISRDSTGATLYLSGTELRVGAGGTGPVGTRRYSHAGRTVATRTGTGGITWLFGDPQGTATVSIRASDQAILRRHQTPFGTARGSVVSWPDRYGYVGGVNDTTGLVHLGAREYDAAAGRFISVDPVADVTNPQQLQGYSYATNNPTTLSDPSGEEPGSWCTDGICSLLVENGIPRDSAVGIFIRQQLELPACPAFYGCNRPSLDAILAANKEIQKLPASDADYQVIEFSYPVTLRKGSDAVALPTNKTFNESRVNVLRAMNTSECLATLQGPLCLNQIRKGLNVGTKPAAGPSIVSKTTTPTKEVKVTMTFGIIVSRTGEVYFSVGVVRDSGGGDSGPALSLREGTVHTVSGQPATAEELADAIPGLSVAVSKYNLHQVTTVSREVSTDENKPISVEVGYTTQSGAGSEVNISCTGQTIGDYMKCLPFVS